MFKGVFWIRWHDKFGDLAQRVNLRCSALNRYVDIYNLFFKSSSLTWCIFMIIPPTWVTLKMLDIVILHFHCSYHGLFASTFKVLIGFPLVILLTRHGRTGIWRWVCLRRHPCELGRFRVRMPIGVGLMAWAPLSPYEFPLLDVSVLFGFRPCSWTRPSGHLM